MNCVLSSIWSLYLRCLDSLPCRKTERLLAWQCGFTYCLLGDLIRQKQSPCNHLYYRINIASALLIYFPDRWGCSNKNFILQRVGRHEVQNTAGYEYNVCPRVECKHRADGDQVLVHELDASIHRSTYRIYLQQRVYYGVTFFDGITMTWMLPQPAPLVSWLHSSPQWWLYWHVGPTQQGTHERPGMH